MLPPVLVPRNPQPITGPRYEPTRYGTMANQAQAQVYSPRSDVTFEYPGMVKCKQGTSLYFLVQKHLHQHTVQQ